jgi:hypothetical protein
MQDIPLVTKQTKHPANMKRNIPEKSLQFPELTKDSNFALSEVAVFF